MSNTAKDENSRAAGTMRIGDADVVATPVPAAEPVLKFFGDYTVLGEIAVGGMGVVYYARHRKLNRTVALKMIRAGTLAKEDEVRRFRIEAEAAANLDHPNIVPIYELGEHEGRHYFSMKFVEGESLHDFNVKCPARDANWFRRISQLMVKITRAVQHAHERAILHRDLKPKNILIDEAGEPHVTDFGLAKVIGQTTTETVANAIMGTPHYMSPEQAAGRTRDVTTAADVYSLGAVLFELLVGHPPFQGDTLMRVIEQVRVAVPPNPSELNPAVPRDLETICLKCLEKEPAQRYASAAVLADELDRWLAGEPIHARPATPVERVTKWVRRNPRLAGALGVAAACALIAAIGITWEWLRAEKNYANSQQLNAKLEIQRAEAYFTDGNSSAALATLARTLRDNPANAVASARLINALNYRHFLVPMEAAGAGVSSAELAGEDAWLITGTNTQGSVVTLRRKNSAPVPFHHGRRSVLGARLSPDGQMLATGSEDGLRIWNAHDGSLLRQWLTNKVILFVAFVPAPSGETIAAVTADAVWLVSTNAARAAQEMATGHADVTLAAQSADRRTLALATEAGHLLVRDFNADREWLVISNTHTVVIRALAFGGTRWLASASADHTARIWDLRSGQPEAMLAADAALLNVEFSPDHLQLVTADRDGNVQVWNALTRKPAAPVMKHPAAVNAARFSPDGQRLVTACFDGITRLWAVGDGQPLAQTLPGRREIIDVAFSHDGRTILSVADNGPALIYASLGGASAQVMLSDPAGLKSFATKATPPPPAELKVYAAGHTDEVMFSDLSPDGTLAATASGDRTVRVWVRARREPLYDPLPHDTLVNCVRFSRDGRLLATSTAGGKVRVWDTQSGQPITDLLRSRDAVAQIWLTPDATHVVTDLRQVWDLYSSREPAPPWLPDFAETIAGVRLDERRVMKPVAGGSVAALRARLAQDAGTNGLAAWSEKFIYELPAQNP